MQWTASVSDYTSVRDEASRRLLVEAGVQDEVAIVPDTGLDISRVWTEEELDQAREEAFESRGMGLPERSIVFHLNARYVNESLDDLAARIDRICISAGAKPVLIAIGPCHGDDALQRSVADKMQTEPLLIDNPQGLKEIASCIARAEAYMGSSMHGLITAYSFGRRGIAIAAKSQVKFSGFLEQFRLSEWQTETWAEAEDSCEGLFNTQDTLWESILAQASPLLDEHWSHLKTTLTSPVPDNKGNAVERLTDIKREYSGQDGMFSGILAEHLIAERAEANHQRADFEQTISKLNQDISRLKKDLETVDGWMSDVSSYVPALFGSKQWRAGHGLGEVYRRARRAPRVPTAANHLDNVVRQYRAWKSGKGEAGAAGGAALQPVAPEGRPERVVRILFELATRRRSFKPFIKSVSERGVSAGRRRLRREMRKRRPRMSREKLAERIRERLGPTPNAPASGWSFVSIIVLHRNGLSYLEKLFAGLADHTDYPGGFEVVLVDNGSTDGSVEFARSAGRRFAVQVVENGENLSFSEGNNQGARAAFGDLLLFMNNDVEPFETGWLKEMVARLEGDQAVGAVGARLLYPGVTEHDTPTGYAVQHRGIKFRKVNGEDYPRNLGVGEDALDEHLGEVSSSPAAQAACLLMRREAFDAAGGFTPGYRYGSEDVDLGLKLVASGKEVLASGRAVLLHDESRSQNTAGRDFMKKNRTGNRKLFLERWGPMIHRKLRLERLGAGSFWTEEPPHVAITLSSNDPKDGYGDWYTAHEMGDALEARGWRVSYAQRKKGDWYRLPESLDYLFVLIDQYDISKVPPGVTTIAWIRNWTDRWLSHPWFEDYDVVLASSAISKEIVERESNQKVSALMPIAANPKRFARAPVNDTSRNDYVFTGNFWGEVRGAVGGFEIRSGEKFELFGKGWKDVPRLSEYARGSVHYDELPRVYSSAKLVIDDTASPTLPYGAVNSRVFDALATGTLVVTNCEAGVRELFDEDFPTYNGPAELRATLDALLADEDRREELAERYQRMVLEGHTYEKRAEQLTTILRRRAGALGFCIKTGIPMRKEAESWGDLHYARAIKRQLEERGHPCKIQTLDEWDAPEGLSYDVALHLKGLTPYTPKTGQLNVLWNISHPEKLTSRECDGYDLVFVASRRWAEQLREATNVPILVLEQATDPDVFFPEYDPAHDRELVFVGNSRRVRRRVLDDLLPTNRNLAVWGRDWEGLIGSKHIVGHYLPNREVHKAYSSAAIVLNDHWDDMREHGYISNRIYDALASGAMVISDDLPELRESFGDAVVTYRTPEELERLISHYLESPEERREKGRRGRELVLADHTFERRAEELLRHVTERLKDTSVRNRIHSFAL
jgi:GT2 family glycosyltransferase/spore maturation protein CgeB